MTYLTPDVVRGETGHLFLVGGAQKVYDYVSGGISVRESIIKLFRRNIEGRAKYCSSKNIHYSHIICPDKHTIHGPEFPLPLKFNVLAIFEEACGGLFTTPKQGLLARNGGQTYWKTDTHWNLHGKLAFVENLLASLGLLDAAAARILADVPGSARVIDNFCGDLGDKISDPPHESGLLFDKPDPVFTWSNNLKGNNGTIRVLINPSVEAGRLLIFGDSFAMSCVEILSLFFKEILLVRSPYFHREISDMFRPTHVVTAMVERYLPSTASDRQAPVALLMHGLNGRAIAPDPGYYESLDAVLRPGSVNEAKFYATLPPAQRGAA